MIMNYNLDKVFLSLVSLIWTWQIVTLTSLPTFTEYSQDLPSYLQYCKDVVFSGLQPSFEDHEEEKLMEELWDFYQNSKVSKLFDPPTPLHPPPPSLVQDVTL